MFSIYAKTDESHQILSHSRWIKQQYNNPDVIITETGWSDEGELNDDGRVEYLRSHLIELLTCINRDECNLKGYIGKLKLDFPSNACFDRIFFLYSMVDYR